MLNDITPRISDEMSNSTGADWKLGDLFVKKKIKLESTGGGLKIELSSLCSELMFTVQLIKRLFN